MMNLHEIHDKQNEEYISAKAQLYEASQTISADELKSIANDRLNKLCAVMSGINIPKTKYVETIDTLVSFFDDVVQECVVITGRREEIEKTIIGLCKEALENETASRDPENEHVTAKIIDCINAAPSADISKEMAAAVLDDTNPLRLGLTFYIDFCEKNPNFTDADSLNYLKTESDVRDGLILGNDLGAFEGLEKLLTSPIDCPEKYLLISLNSFYHGFDADAVNALEIGLVKFPNNERLLSAKGALA